MKPRKAALVYTPDPTPRTIRQANAYLQEVGAYRFDVRQETAAHAADPVLDRPVLRRFMWMAAYDQRMELW